MGKRKIENDFAAFQDQDGKWVGMALRDKRIVVPGLSEEDALRKARALYNEVQQDERYLDGLAEQRKVNECTG